jgi:hypothetical protein
LTAGAVQSAERGIDSTLSGGRGGPLSVPVALDWAEVAALLGDFRDAVTWLDYVERVDGTLPPEFAAQRRAWLERL